MTDSLSFDELNDLSLLIPPGWPRTGQIPEDRNRPDWINSYGDRMPGVRNQREADLCMAYALGAGRNRPQRTTPPETNREVASVLLSLAADLLRR